MVSNEKMLAEVAEMEKEFMAAAQDSCSEDDMVKYLEMMTGYLLSQIARLRVELREVRELHKEIER